MTDTRPSVQIAGNRLVPQHIQIEGGAYGSVGDATIRVSMSALDAAGIDLFDIAAQAPGSTQVLVNVSQDGGAPVRIFGGEYKSTAFDHDADQIVIHARSWAGVLADQKRVLTQIASAIETATAPLVPGQVLNAQGVATENQKVGQIVTAIAAEFGFTPVLNIQAANNPTFGALYGTSDTAFVPSPRSLWEILVDLARDTGYEVYVTPNKALVFGAAGAGLTPIALSYNVAASNQALPCGNLVIDHHPRRNSTFRVLVISYDAGRSQTTIGRTVFVSPEFAGSRGSVSVPTGNVITSPSAAGAPTTTTAAATLQAGLQSGPAALRAEQIIASLNASQQQVPLYTFHVDGLSADQAQQRADAIATDIAKRHLILHCRTDGLPGILPTNPLRLSGAVRSSFTANPWYVASYTHTIAMPKGQGDNQAAGWWTEITALDLPTTNLGSTSE